MSEKHHAAESNPVPLKHGVADSGDVQAPEPATGEVKELTAEEQMALYEKELKENDWGHQPC
jgi:hypothetical protein